MTTFYVKVIPGQDEWTIDLSGTYPRISLKQPASNGRANNELVNELHEILETPVRIVPGYQSRRKQLAVDLERDEIDQRLHAAQS